AAQQMQERAWAAFDGAAEPGAWEQAEQLWQRALELRQAVDEHNERAGRALETAFLHDSSRGELRRRYAETLYQRAARAVPDHRQADGLLSRLWTYDEDGRFHARWVAPATLGIDSEPRGARIEIATYESERGARILTAAHTLGHTPLSHAALPPGSYLLTVTIAG